MAFNLSIISLCFFLVFTSSSEAFVFYIWPQCFATGMFLYPSQSVHQTGLSMGHSLTDFDSCRRTQRKPDQGLINKFKESFRDIVPSTTAKRDAEPIEHVGESTTGYVAYNLAVSGIELT